MMMHKGGEGAGRQGGRQNALALWEWRGAMLLAAVGCVYVHDIPKAVHSSSDFGFGLCFGIATGLIAGGKGGGLGLRSTSKQV